MRRTSFLVSACWFVATACGDSGSGESAIDPNAPIGVPTTPATIAGCRIYPSDNAWNLDVSATQLHPRHRQLRTIMNPTRGLHPDWGNWEPDHYGIPWESGTGAPDAPITWTASWGDEESDPRACTVGPTNYDFCYPIPVAARIEGGPDADPDADRHVLYLDTAGAPDDCVLYELYQVQDRTGLDLEAANGAIFDLSTNTLRTEGFTSADAAGLPILPGLVRYDEVAAGEIRHAIRFTMSRTSDGHIHPATHHAGDSDSNLPPMGLRVRLRADYPEVGVSDEAAVILRAMKKYGMILADNGSDWYFTGDSDDRWDAVMDGILDALGDVHGGDFEAVYTGPTITD